MTTSKQLLSAFLSFSVTFSVIGLDACKKSDQTQSQSSQGQPGQAPATTYAAPTADQLYQLVAPIALFPDNLVAQVLAASTFPNEVSEAYTWLQKNSGLKGQQLVQAANEQSWDPSVKGLTQFPDVLNQMATNLSWTSALGDAYFNIPQSVMNAVQVMRQRAYQAGNLKDDTAAKCDGGKSSARGCTTSSPTGGFECPATAANCGGTASTADHHYSANPTRRCLRAGLQSNRRIWRTGCGLSRIFNRCHGGHQPDLVWSGYRGGRRDQRWRRVLRLGMELVGLRLAQFHRGL